MDNYKVVCIVQNQFRENKTGLKHTFEDINGILNFQNAYLFSADEYKLGHNNDNFLIISKDSVKLNSDVTNTDKWDIILVGDNLDIMSYPSCLFGDNILFMYHTHPANTKDLLTKKKRVKYLRKGMHEQDDFDGYHRIGKLFQVWNEKSNSFEEKGYKEALKSIIDWFRVNDKLEDALNFLHECLGGEKPDLELYTEFTIEEKTEISILLAVMPQNMNEDLVKFKNLRDKVLDLVGINE